MPHTSHLQKRSPTSIALLFLQSCLNICLWSLNAHCALAYITCWPLDRWILHEVYFACAATSRVPPAVNREWFHHLANGSQLHAFSQGRACLLRSPDSFHWGPAHAGGDLRAQLEIEKEHRWHCICFQEATSFPCFVVIGNGSPQILGHERESENLSEEAPTA